MEPQVFAAIGAAIAMGISGGKIIDHIWPKNGNGKIELLLEQQIELMKKADDRAVAQATSMALMQQEMENHEKRESKAWDDIFTILRKEQ